MPLFTPTIVFERITCITPEFLGARGLRALILDVDNTLTGHGSQELPPDEMCIRDRSGAILADIYERSGYDWAFLKNWARDCAKRGIPSSAPSRAL